MPPAFRRLAWSTLAAHSSEQVALAAAPLVAVLSLGASAAATGWLQTAQTLPFLLLSLVAGVLADRHSRRRLMMAAETVRALATAAIVLLLWGDGMTLSGLALLGFLGAVGTVGYSVAAPALLPALVGVGNLSRANRWLELARSGAFAAGPALGGAIVGWTGAPSAFVLAAILSLTAIGLLAGLPDDTPAPAPRRGLLVAELKEGARFLMGHRLLGPVVLTAVVFNTSWFLLQAVFVAYAVDRLGLTPSGIGTTLAGFGVGMLAGASAAPLIARRLTFGAIVLTGPFSALTGSLLMVLTTVLPWNGLAVLSMVLFGAGPILWAISTTTLRQAVTPNAMLGRVSATLLMATAGARPLGAGLGAILADTIGVDACLWAAAAGFALQAAIIAASPIPRLATLPEPD